jgi:hypothetical protein
LLRITASLLALLAGGCTCSSNPDFPDADLIPADSSVSDGGMIDAPSSCDELTGERCPCPADGETRSCLTGGVGACGMGTQTCVTTFEFPSWGPCTGEAEPSDETCNGIDDDCDDMLDEGLGEQTCGMGPCEVTLPNCVAGVEQTCVPGMSRPETCDGTDEDCNGMIDDTLTGLTCGVGECLRTVAACVDGTPGLCVPADPSPETCNNSDDDCDSMIDEALPALTCGVGACFTTVAACSSGTPNVCNAPSGTAEICNGIDDDCNGTIDDGFGTITCGTGECQRVVLDCAGGGGGVCTPGTPVAEVCDGRDNNCDGMIDNLPPITCGLGECFRSEPACVGGAPNICRAGTPSPEMCDGRDNDCDGSVDNGIAAITCGVGACRMTVPGCTGGVPGRCMAGAPSPEICGNLIDEDCNGTPDDMCGCDTRVDRDFDTYNECADCDDSNGGVHPTRPEVCNGIDEDCDRLVDEDFDRDGDRFATCSSDPLQRDCDDTNRNVYPGAMENCGADGRGNGIDDDCDGYIDDGCAPCTTTDVDRDGVTQCMGDCDDNDATRSPLRPEACDGRDTDCNIFTTRNCGVSERCNFTTMADVCESDLLCICDQAPSGGCSTNFFCRSFCEGSYTGDLGAGCTATQTCGARITLTDNLHGCGEVPTAVGTRQGGEVCTAASQCRSLSCDRYCMGPGCSTERCIDYCTHDGTGNGGCATGTVCQIVSTPAPSASMYALCRLDTGTRDTGAACSATQPCRFGAQSCVSGICAEPCALESHCPTGFHCGLDGNSVRVGTWGGGAPAFVSGQPAIETVPVCLTDTGAGLHNRPAGAACARNGDCESQFCERTLGVCITPCTSDGSCGAGLDCEPQYVQTAAGVFLARVCMSTPVDALLRAM